MKKLWWGLSIIGGGLLLWVMIWLFSVGFKSLG